MTGANLLGPAPDPDAPQRAILLSVPFFHATGCFAVMIPVMFGGAKIVLQRKWDAEQALGLIERERINQIGGVPTIAWQVIEHPRAKEFDLSSIESAAQKDGWPAEIYLRDLTDEGAICFYLYSSVTSYTVTIR